MQLQICDALRDLVPFVQFKKRQKHPWRSDKTLLKVALLHGCFSHFLIRTNGTKSCNVPQLCYITCLLPSRQQKIERF